MVFGAHRKPEAVVIPFEVYAGLLPLIEDLEIAQIVRERAAAGLATPLVETTAKLGIDLDALRPMALRLTEAQGFAHDLLALPSRALAKRAPTLPVKVSRGNLTGQPVGALVTTGDLRDFRKIYFDVDNNQKPRYCRVYCLTPAEVRAVPAMSCGSQSRSAEQQPDQRS
jgi:hypothetical protein